MGIGQWLFTSPNSQNGLFFSVLGSKQRDARVKRVTSGAHVAMSVMHSVQCFAKGTYVLMNAEQRAKMPLMLGEFQIFSSEPVLNIEFTRLG